MRYPRVLIHEHNGRIARFFHELNLEKKPWTVHEPRRFEDCLELLDDQGAAVLIVNLGRNVEGELELLQRVAWRFPETACLVASETDDPELLGLAWDLGARHVLAPPQSLDLLLPLAAAFLGVAVTVKS